MSFAACEIPQLINICISLAMKYNELTFVNPAWLKLDDIYVIADSL